MPARSTNAHQVPLLGFARAAAMRSTSSSSVSPCTWWSDRCARSWRRARRPLFSTSPRIQVLGARPAAAAHRCTSSSSAGWKYTCRHADRRRFESPTWDGSSHGAVGSSKTAGGWGRQPPVRAPKPNDFAGTAPARGRGLYASTPDARPFTASCQLLVLKVSGLPIRRRGEPRKEHVSNVRQHH
jgi:hypothetical protein